MRKWALIGHWHQGLSRGATNGAHVSNLIVEMTGEFGAGERARTVGLNLGKDARTLNSNSSEHLGKLVNPRPINGLAHLVLSRVNYHDHVFPRSNPGTFRALSGHCLRGVA
jgi:hypothetical protein